MQDALSGTRILHLLWHTIARKYLCENGAASGILFLLGGGYQEISDTITYTICTVGGMVCDGAKSSCAAKIATALETAFTGMEISRKNRRFRGGDGLVKENVEETIASVGRMGKQGMRETNIAILNIMME